MDDGQRAESGRWTGQGLRYLASGAAQFALDWAVFAVLHAATGASGLPNLAGRVSGALLGFAINSRWTFGGAPAWQGPRFRRFGVLWLLQTAASTALVWGAARWLPAGGVYLAKPAIEIALAAAGFLAWRGWIRHAH
ncbi:MAG: GtrA family protein [Pseudomonadota bacterium]|jgi:putative flippase GtrA